MSGGVFAAALVMTVTWTNRKNCKWTERSMRMARMDRPFHTTSVVYLDAGNWRKEGAGCLFRQMISEYVYGDMVVCDESMFNIMHSVACHKDFLCRRHTRDTPNVSHIYLILRKASGKFCKFLLEGCNSFHAPFSKLTT